MKALTLYQPWARLVAEGLKTIETRAHARFACLAGQRIAIHAGQRLCVDLEWTLTDVHEQYLDCEQMLALRLRRLGEKHEGCTKGSKGRS